jgi:hypothetical protein
MRKMVLLRWVVGAVGAGSVPGGAVGGARFGVLRLGKGRVPSRGYVGRGKVPVAGKRGAGVGRWQFELRRAGRRRAWRRSAGHRGFGRGRRVGQQPQPRPVAGDGAPRCEVRGKVVAFQRFLERAADVTSGHPNGRGCATQPVSSCRGARLMGMRAAWPA